MSNFVFVFGTLKQGYPNFPTNRGTRVTGDFITVERYPLYLMSNRFSPWLVFLPGEGEQVVGQLFEVNESTLDAMDFLERVAEPDGYRRVSIDVERVDGPPGLKRLVHAYVKAPEHFLPAEVRAGPLREYTMEHAILYKSRAPIA
jgi:gamma-glutamylaminecyclotransferase